LLTLFVIYFLAEESSAVVLHDSEVNFPVGVPLSEVYLDSCFANVGPFAVIRGEKRVSYTIRTVNGKSAVVPFEFDGSSPAKTVAVDDQKVSANSELKPEATSPCAMCGEMMLEAASVQHFLHDSLVQPKHRELQCGSGHRYCFSCWAGYLQAHAADKEGLYALNCPNKECGESLDLQWAPVLLKSPDLVNRVLAQRQRQITDRLKLHWCSVPKCGLIVHVHTAEGEEDRGSDCTAGSIPLCGLCSNGHGICLCCGAEPHAPSKCDDITKWADLTREVSRTAQAKDRNHPANILHQAPRQKACTQCGVLSAKAEGSNHMRCTGCFREFCWMCGKDWAAHNATSAARHSADEEENGELPFQCNTWVDPVPVAALSERHALFVRYFARHQAHLESFNLELTARKACIERVVQGLKASHDGELQWLLGKAVRNPYEPAQRSKEKDAGKDTHPALADTYLPRDKAVEFLLQAFEELEKCRTLLRWSYPYAMFQYEDEFRKAYGPNGMMLIPSDRWAQRVEFQAAQNVLERQVEALSDLLSHRRLHGNKDDITEAYLAAKAQRIALETVVVAQNPTFGSQSMELSRSKSADDRRQRNSEITSSTLRGMAFVEDEGPLVPRVVMPAQASASPAAASASSASKVSSYTAAMEFDMSEHTSQQAQSQGRLQSAAAPVSPQRPTSGQRQPPPTATKAPIVEEPDSDGEYGYGSGDEEGLQVCTDVSVRKQSPKSF
jgi:hypothetical protein